MLVQLVGNAKVLVVGKSTKNKKNQYQQHNSSTMKQKKKNKERFVLFAMGMDIFQSNRILIQIIIIIVLILVE